LEKVYENAMMIEFKKLGLNAVQRARNKVYYDGEVVGEYAADLLVENQVLVELKATPKLADEHEAQLLNYLKRPSTKSACRSISAPSRKSHGRFPITPSRAQ
jgi:GxxExxY protein